MKKVLLFITLFGVALSLHAQAPQGINYQAVARNTAGAPITGTSVNVGFKIREGSNGPVIYDETHTGASTGTTGLFTLTIGQGQASVGTFSSVPWATGTKFLEVLINGASAGTQQMMSVPYALFAASGNQGSQGATGAQGPQGNPGLQGATGLQGLQGQPGPAYVPEIVIIEERTPANSGMGGGGAAQNFTRRKLNTITTGANSNVSLDVSNNTFELKSGTYIIQAAAPANRVNTHRIVLRDQSNDQGVLFGTNEYSPLIPNLATVQTTSHIYGKLEVPLNSTRRFRLEHWVDSTNTDTNALGNAPSFNGLGVNNIYARVVIEKIQ